jgi:D-galactarolactone isomerase
MSTDVASGATAAPMVRGEPLEAPHSSGTGAPDTPAPPGATDCHHHVSDPRFPKADGSVGTPATVADYRQFKRRLGVSRSIVIAASPYGDDNRGLVDALRQLGGDAARGVALVYPEVSDGQLDALHGAGVRGMRVYLNKGRALTTDDVRGLAARAAQRGWHLQFVGDRHAELVAAWEKTLAGLPCRVVIDHLGYAPQPAGLASATAQTLLRLLERGHTYVKLSGVYIQSQAGYPDYGDVDALAAALVKAAPERMLWGTDWPHPGATPRKPDGARLFDQLARWAPMAATRRRILVENPDALYWSE